MLALRLKPGAHELIVLGPDGSRPGEFLVGVLPLPAARLLPSPDPAVAGLLITGGSDGTEIWRVIAGRLHLALRTEQQRGGGV